MMMQDQTIRAFSQYLKVGIFELIRKRDLDLEIGWDIFVVYLVNVWDCFIKLFSNNIEINLANCTNK